MSRQSVAESRTNASASAVGADASSQSAAPRAEIGWPARPASWADCFDPRRPEAFLAFCSAWCSLQMWFWPDQFAAANAFVATQVGLRGHEKSWAIFAFVAATLKMLGLICRLSVRWCGFSDGLLVAGLFMSVVFWMIVALSHAFDLPHSITPIALIGFAIAAAWQLAEWRAPGTSFSSQAGLARK
ncbi:MAG TPA: hypothetical protein VGG99_22410 [Acetobacteraceae bacterium]|jgi:hypothetical protein